jgi:hypothetical protein
LNPTDPSNGLLEVNDIVGYWAFDESDGNTAYDVSGYDNNGTVRRSVE